MVTARWRGARSCVTPQCIAAHDDSIWSCAWGKSERDGQEHIITGSVDDTVRLWRWYVDVICFSLTDHIDSQIPNVHFCGGIVQAVNLVCVTFHCFSQNNEVCRKKYAKIILSFISTLPLTPPKNQVKMLKIKIE